MNIFGLVIKSKKNYTQAMAELIVEVANQKFLEYQKGYSKGREFERNKQVDNIISKPYREATEILWQKEGEEGEL